MKKQTKGIIFTVLFGGGLLFWATAATLPGITPEDPSEKVTITGTPMDNYPDVQRAQFCGSNEEAKSTRYVTEYKIPTPCTQPLAIVTDTAGNVWFAQTNTGNITKFDPRTETFHEFDNPRWPQGARSMMWGIDYSPDDSLWFTDEAFDSIWKFSIQDESYQRTDYPRVMDSLPQKLAVDGSMIIVNDFTGNKLTFHDPTQSTEGISYLTIPSPVDGSVTGGFGIDSENNVWYTNWIFGTGGVLVKLNQDKIMENSEVFANNETSMFDVIDIYQFPPGMTTPNGVSPDPNGYVWIADTSSSFFFKFDPNTESFTKYVTSVPPTSAYGNSTGVIKLPVSRPYWTEIDEQGRLVFNEQTGNRIGVFDPKTETLLEYDIPSKNPDWADCGSMNDCGLAQVFDITVDGNTIWFTEWVENNIGKIDTSIPILFDVEIDKTKINLKKGESAQLQCTISSNGIQTIDNLSLTSASTASFSDIVIDSDQNGTIQLDSNGQKIIQITISASNSALSDIHKVLIGAQTDEITVSKYVTVIIE